MLGPFNRTFMELKRGKYAGQSRVSRSFNRTFMELKQRHENFHHMPTMSF